jgi:hypothetical protein
MGAHGRGVRARKRSGAQGKDGGLEAALSLNDEKMQRQRGGRLQRAWQAAVGAVPLQPCALRRS